MRPACPLSQGERGTGGEDQVDHVRDRPDDREREDRRRGIERAEGAHVKVPRHPNDRFRRGHRGRHDHPAIIRPRTVLTVVLGSVIMKKMNSWYIGPVSGAISASGGPPVIELRTRANAMKHAT